MDNPTAPFITEELTPEDEIIISHKTGDVPRLRREGQIGYREMYGLALYHLVSLVTTLLPTGEGKSVNNRRLQLQIQRAYGDLAVSFRQDIAGAMQCREPECQCHRALYNILGFENLEMPDADREYVGDLGPDKVECDPETEALIRREIFEAGGNPPAHVIMGAVPQDLMGLFAALFGEPEPEPKQPEPAKA